MTPLSRSISQPAVSRTRRAADRPRGWEASWLARAAVLLVVLGLGTWNYQLRADNRVKERTIATSNAIARLMSDPTATRVPLARQGSGNESALVVMKGDVAYLMVSNFARNESENSIYVLWAQDKGSEAMYGVDKFKVVHDAPNMILVRKDLTNSGSIAAFAVSKESGTEIPTTPSAAIVLGKVRAPDIAT